MTFSRLSGSRFFETCSADTTVPWMTSMSSSPAVMAGQELVGALRRDRRDATTTPASRIWRMRSVTSSGLIGSR